MFTVELYARIRRAVMVEGLSQPPRGGDPIWPSPEHDHQDASVFGSTGLPAGRTTGSKNPGPQIAWTNTILEADRGVRKKQRHTAQRIPDDFGMNGDFPAAKRSCVSCGGSNVAIPRNVPAAEPASGSRPGGFWRG
jgi:hypothetical protein